MATAFSERMIDWSRKRATRLADEFTRAGSSNPTAFFDAACSRNRLLAALRPAAEPTFMARLAELERTNG